MVASWQAWHTPQMGGLLYDQAATHRQRTASARKAPGGSVLQGVNPRFTRLCKACLSSLALPAGLVSGPVVMAANATSPVGLETIVVTAQKRAARLEDIPLAITVVDAGTLASSRSRTLDELQGLVPNFQLERAGFNSLAIRGAGGGGRNIGFDTRVGLYLDGVYIGQAQSLGMPLFDISQVEVLKGPQGHLFGRNTVAGAVNLVSTPPAAEPAGTLNAVYGNRDTMELYATVTGPLAPGVLGRLAAGWETRDGYTRNRFDAQRLDELERITLRAQLALAPADRLTLNLYGDFADTQENAIIGEPVTDFFDTPFPDGPLPPRQVDFNTRPYTDARLHGGRVTADYAVTDTQAITAITGYRSIRHRRQNDTDYGPLDLLRIDYADDFSQWSQELRIASSEPRRIQYLAGLYYLYEEADSRRDAIIGEDTAAVVPLPASAPVPMAPFGAAFQLEPGAIIGSEGRVRTSSLAAFTTLDIALITGLTLNLGARWTTEERRLTYDLDGSQSGAFGIGNLDGFKDRQRDRELNLSTALTWALGPQTNLYARYANGFKSGGWNIDFLNSNQIDLGFDFATETVDSLELGLKGIAEGNRLRWSAAVFNNRFDDFQVFQFVALPGGATVLQLRNAARVTTRGLEFSGDLQLTDDLLTRLSYGTVRARFNSFPGGGAGGADLSGTLLPGVPRHTASLIVEYGKAVPALAGRLDLYGDFSYSDGFLPMASADPAAPTIGSTRLVNLRLGYTHADQRLGVALWSRNLFDHDYLRREGRDFLGNQFVLRGEPRSVGIELWTRR